MPNQLVKHFVINHIHPQAYRVWGRLSPTGNNRGLPTKYHLTVESHVIFMKLKGIHHRFKRSSAAALLSLLQSVREKASFYRPQASFAYTYVGKKASPANNHLMVESFYRPQASFAYTYVGKKALPANNHLMAEGHVIFIRV
jgi:hypothetical protein